MKILARFGVPSALVALVAVVLTSHAFGSAGPDGRANNQLKGAYSFRLDAANDDNAYLGVLTLDGNGGVPSGRFVENDHGALVRFPVTGSYSVNNDGMGTMTLSFLVGDHTINWSFEITIAHNGNDAYLLSDVSPVSGEMAQQ